MEEKNNPPEGGKKEKDCPLCSVSEDTINILKAKGSALGRKKLKKDNQQEKEK